MESWDLQVGGGTPTTVAILDLPPFKSKPAQEIIMSINLTNLMCQSLGLHTVQVLVYCFV